MQIVSDGHGDDAGDETYEAWRRQVPPENEVAGTVAVDTVVTRNDDAAVTLRSLRVHRDGIVLSFVLQRRVDPGLNSPESFRSIEAEVLLGVELSDGSTATSFQHGRAWQPGAADDQTPSLRIHGGGGGNREYEMKYWLRPRPPPGDLVVIVASVPLELAEARVVVPGDTLAEAASRVQVLWAREPERQYDEGPLAPPEVPPGGWFEAVLNRP